MGKRIERTYIQKDSDETFGGNNAIQFILSIFVYDKHFIVIGISINSRNKYFLRNKNNVISCVDHLK